MLLPSLERQKGTEIIILGKRISLGDRKFKETIAKALDEADSYTVKPQQKLLRNIPPLAEKNLSTTSY